MKPTKVAIYARVSPTVDQDPDAQPFALREYAERRGFVVYREYVDHVTGVVEKRSTTGKIKHKAYQPADGRCSSSSSGLRARVEVRPLR